jgi:hypothetical protein
MPQSERIGSERPARHLRNVTVTPLPPCRPRMAGLSVSPSLTILTPAQYGHSPYPDRIIVASSAAAFANELGGGGHSGSEDGVIDIVRQWQAEPVTPGFDAITARQIEPQWHPQQIAAH